MTDDGAPSAWGLWNATVGDWFNPGTRKPYYATRADAERALPMARRQWAKGTWVVSPYPLRDLIALEPEPRDR